MSFCTDLFYKDLSLRLKIFLETHKKKVLLFIIFIPILAGVVYYVFSHYNFSKEEKIPTSASITYNQVKEKFIQGYYDEGLTLLQKALKESPDDTALKKLNSILSKELRISLKISYYLNGKTLKESQDITTSLSLSPKDPYYLNIIASRKCYLYLFQIDPKNKLYVIFPNHQFSLSKNPIPPGRMRIPDGFRWFRPDRTQGIETIYLLATPIENKRIIELAKDPDSLKEYLEQLQTSKINKIKGIVIKKLCFSHVNKEKEVL